MGGAVSVMDEHSHPLKPKPGLSGPLSLKFLDLDTAIALRPSSLISSTGRTMAETVTLKAPPDYDTRFFGHPRGLATLFFTEMWERYSYYGTRALLILYMTAAVSTGGLGFSVMKAGSLYGFYTAMVYLLGVPGGWVADRLIGQQKAVLLGGIFIAAGNFCLASPGLVVFYTGLGLLMIGTGLLKPNVSTIVGQLYTPQDKRRDAGFSIFYMGINIGAFSPLIVGWVGEKVNWRLGFATSAIGMLIGVVQYLITSKYLGESGLRPTSTGDALRDRKQKRNSIIAVVALLAVLAFIAVLASSEEIQLSAETISNALGWVLLAIAAVVFSWMILGKGSTPQERKRAGAILVLFIASAVFWAAYEQAGSTLNLFADRNTDRHVSALLPGVLQHLIPASLRDQTYPTSWFQNIQPLFVLILAPIYAWLWIRLGKREPSSPGKFSFGVFFVGLSFLVLVPAASGMNVSPYWLSLSYFLSVVGEMCLSPVGLSAMTKLAPARAMGFVMGVWFLSISIGDWLAGKAGSLFESMPLKQLFGFSALIPIGAAVILALLVRPTKRLMSGVS
jgi:POT family proton-dependent oligopeptide transporter